MLFPTSDVVENAAQIKWIKLTAHFIHPMAGAAPKKTYWKNSMQLTGFFFFVSIWAWIEK